MYLIDKGLIKTQRFVNSENKISTYAKRYQRDYREVYCYKKGLWGKYNTMRNKTLANK